LYLLEVMIPVSKNVVQLNLMNQKSMFKLIRINEHKIKFETLLKENVKILNQWISQWEEAWNKKKIVWAILWWWIKKECVKEKIICKNDQKISNADQEHFDIKWNVDNLKKLINHEVHKLNVNLI